MDVAFVISAYGENQYPPSDRPEIAFAGRSNVGKSSLINVLVNRKGLAKTSSRPGRTQAINFFLLDERIYLVDLPGYGYAQVPLKIRASWRRMVEDYLRGRSNLRGVVVVLDIRRELSEGDKDLLRWLDHYEIRAIPVLTKADKLSRNQAASRAREVGEAVKPLGSSPPILFSARTRQGKTELWEEIRRHITA